MKIFYKLGTLFFVASPFISAISCNSEQGRKNNYCVESGNKKAQVLAKDLSIFKNLNQLLSNKNSTDLKKILANNSGEKEINLELLGVQLPKISNYLKWIIKVKNYDPTQNKLHVWLSLTSNEVLMTKTIFISPNNLSQEKSQTKSDLFPKLNSYGSIFLKKLTKELPLDDLQIFLTNGWEKNRLQEFQTSINNLPTGITTNIIVHKIENTNLKEVKINFLKNRKIIKTIAQKIDLQEVANLVAAKSALENLEYLVTNLPSKERLEIAFNTYKSIQPINLLKIGIEKEQFLAQNLEHKALVEKKLDLENPKVTIIVESKIRNLKREIPLKVSPTTTYGLSGLPSYEKEKYRTFLKIFGIKIDQNNIIQNIETAIETNDQQKTLIIKYTIKLPNGKIKKNIQLFNIHSNYNQAIVRKEAVKIHSSYISPAQVKNFEQFAKKLTKQREVQLEELKEVGIILPQFKPDVRIKIYLEKEYQPIDKNLMVYIALNYKNGRHGKFVTISHK